MTLYRARPADGVAWITGASTGIGRQLALDLAAKGYTVAATARGLDRLETLAVESSGLAGRIIPFPGDVTDQVKMAETVAAIETEAGPIVLSVFNAGTYFPTRGDRLDAMNFVKTYEINLFGVIFGMVPAVERMTARGHGHIVLVGSASSYFGLPAASAYGSSKAALNTMAQSLKFDFDKMNIRIQVVNPGFVDTPLTEKNSFAMPALMKVENASRRMVAGIEAGGFEIAFPRRLIWIMKLVRILPQPMRFFLLNRATGWNRRPLPSRNG